jgi:aldehyde dehydrogenase (NAD+)
MWEYLRPVVATMAAAGSAGGNGGPPPRAHDATENGATPHHSDAPTSKVVRDSARVGSTATAAGASGGVPATAATSSLPQLDRTPKLYIGGKQTRPDSGHSRRVLAPDGGLLGAVGEGNRKDLRNAVEAAHKAATWARTTGHARAQILYYIAENMAARAEEFARRLDLMTARGDGAAEVEATVARLFTYAAWADKHDGAVHDVPIRGVALAMHEPIGVVGVACPTERPLLGLVSTIAPLIAMGNTVVAVPSEPHPLAAIDFYGVLDTSDVPGGVVNLVTGPRDALARVLAEHDDVDAVWYFGTRDGARAVEAASAGNMKRTWAEWAGRDWTDRHVGEGREFLRHATQVKNVWVPYGA